MYHNIAEIHNKPAFTSLTLDATSFLVILLHSFQYALGERIEHAVTSSIADHEIIGKRCNIFDIEKQDVFTLFVFQGFDDFMGKFECVQISPLGL